MANPKYHRVLLKVSGESLCVRGTTGIDSDEVRGLAYVGPNELQAVDLATNQLISINESTGAATVLGPTTVDITGLTWIAP